MIVDGASLPGRNAFGHSRALEHSLHFRAEIMMWMSTIVFPYDGSAHPKCVVVLRSPKNGLSGNAVTTTFLCRLPLLS